jgi:hypothetical protein
MRANVVCWQNAQPDQKNASWGECGEFVGNIYDITKEYEEVIEIDKSSVIANKIVEQEPGLYSESIT